MDDQQFDAVLIRTALIQAERQGWMRVTVAGAAREAGLALDRARGRFPTRTCILLKLGREFDQAALVEHAPLGDQGSLEIGGGSSSRERLFDVLMRRFDALQQHRGGVRSLLRSLPFDPALALLLMAETRTSMDWMAQSAGIDTTGPKGAVRVGGLVATWLQALRAWERDDSLDLSGTMAALDRALDRAESFGKMLGGKGARTQDAALGEPPAPPGADTLGENFSPEPPSY